MLKHWKNDFLSSIVVFLVALPLCLGIALASGVPPAAGLITGIVAGLVVGWIAGSPLQVSGPAAGLTVIVYDIVQRYQTAYLDQQGGLDGLSAASRQALSADAQTYAIGMLGLTLILAGAIQFFAGVSKLGQWFRAVSPAVVHGMLAGIGILIFVGQFHVMVDDKPHKHGLDNLLTLPSAIYKGLVPSELGDNHRWAAGIGLATIIIMVLWKALLPKKMQALPAPLVAIIAASLFADVVDLSIRFVDMPDGGLIRAIQLPNLGLIQGAVEAGLLGAVVMAGVTLAVVASAETLLCAGAVDKLHQGPRTKYDRELTAQGVGNLICGCLGALPMTGVIVRSAANVEAGAKSRLSAVLHGAWLLALVVIFPHALELIPTASLAAILVYTGYKLVNIKAVKELYRYGIGEVLVYAATTITIVATDLLIGVVTGVVLSALKLLITFARLSVKVEADPVHNRTIMTLRGTATFLRLPRLAEALEQVPGNTELHVRFDQLDYIDHACLDLLMSWEKQHETTGGSLVLDWDTLTARFRSPGKHRRHTPAVAHAPERNGDGAPHQVTQHDGRVH